MTATTEAPTAATPRWGVYHDHPTEAARQGIAYIRPTEGYAGHAAGREVAMVFGADRPERRAHARLIAAAPDLLTACEVALPWVSLALVGLSHVHPDAAKVHADVMATLRAAIVAATGKPVPATPQESTR